MLKKEKGITLIALVITIIVLLILAGITIAMLTGGDSAPAKANEAAQKNDIGTAKDQVYLIAQEAQIKAYDTVYIASGATSENAGTQVGTAVMNAVNGKYSTEQTLGKAKIKSETATKEGKFDAGDLKITITTTDYECIGRIDKTSGVLTWEDIATKTA